MGSTCAVGPRGHGGRIGGRIVRPRPRRRSRPGWEGPEPTNDGGGAMIARFNNLSLGGKLGCLVVLCLAPTGLVLLANVLITLETRASAEEECLKLSDGQLDHVL